MLFRSVVMLARSGINPFTFVHPEVITRALLWLSLGKCFAFGVCIVVGAVSAAFGVRVHGDVGRATTEAVVRATLFALATNLLFDVGWSLA